MNLRRAAHRDADIMARLHGQSFPRGWSAQEMLDLMASPGGVAVIDEAGGGFALARAAADEAEILTIAVDPAQRRGGLGAALLGELETACADAGAAHMFLDVSVSNNPARALYLRANYVEIARRKAYYADGADALILEKALR